MIEEIHPHWLMGNGDPWGSYLLLKFKNVTSKTLAATRFGVSFVDALADAHESVYNYDDDKSIKPGKSDLPEWGDGVYAGDLSHKVGAIVWVEKVRFADNTNFVDDGSHSCGAKNGVAAQRMASSSPPPSRTPAESSTLLEGVQGNTAASVAESGAKPISPKRSLDLAQTGEGSRCTVVTNPPGAEVEIDGKKAGVTPFVFVLLRHGDTPRAVTIKMDGYNTIVKKLVPHGKPIPIGLTLEKE